LAFPKKALASIIALIVILASVTAVAYWSTNTPSPKEKETDIANFEAKLEKTNFTVQEGKLGLFPLVDLYDAGYIKSCWANDPTKPYLVTWLPPAPNERVDASKFRLAQILGYGDGLTNVYHMRPDEAIILIGKTPPECKYFGFSGCLMQRTYVNQTCTIWGEMTDPINNLIIKTGEDTAFSQNTIIICTADEGVDAQIREALQSGVYSNSTINTYVIPSPILKMGLSSNSDTFNFFMRISILANETAGNNYIKNPPITVLRVTPKENTTLNPFETPDLRAQGTNQTELELISGLNALGDAIVEQYSNYTATELSVGPWLPYGTQGIETGTNVAGITRDALYLWTGGTLPPMQSPLISQAKSTPAPNGFTLKDGEFVVVYGVNHQATGKATFASFSVNGADIWNGVAGVTSDRYTGTARQYLSNGTNADYFYAYKISRQGNETNCLTIPGPGLKGQGIELNQEMFILFRMYLEPSTKTSPLPQEILFDHAIKFSLK
jgi:hypothetical protein